MKGAVLFFLLAMGPGLAAAGEGPAAASVESADDLVLAALSSNPQVQAVRARYEAALHQVRQAYAPQDPVLTFQNQQSAAGVFHPDVESLGVSESFQFPGKSWLQGGQAKRAAEIARLDYLAASRDARAGVLSVYYQALLDAALTETAEENSRNLERVLKVAQVAYSANQVTQSDLISAEFDLAQASQTARAGAVAEANDEAALNAALGRDARASLNLARDFVLKPLNRSLDELVGKALGLRQELLQAALAETNSKAALKLARMEYLPDLSVGYTLNRYLLGSAAPAAGVARDNTISLGFNLPVFFWFHQKEDVESARRLLESARADRRGVELQTTASITELYRSTQLAYETALLYRDSLIPLARQDFQVALIAYQSRKVDFPTLAGTLQRIYGARIAYLTAANQFLAGRVALEQAIGEPIEL